MSYASSAASSRRQSMMLPPIGGGIGSALGSPGFPPGNFGSDIGPGPQRHPKPLTAADLHLQLEREQEAVVNRLTRELAALRAQQSSNTIDEPIQTPLGSSPILHHNYSSHIPRHHRTNSNTSTSATGGGVGPNTLSRQNSTRSIRSVNTGGRSSPAIGDLLPLPPHASFAPPVGGSSGTYPYAGYYGYQYQGGLGIATPSANGSEVNLPGGILGSGTEATGQPLAEMMKWRNELEKVKKENEALRTRIKDLEKILKEAGGVEPEGWNGGSVSSAAHRSGRSRSSSISIRERGRREKRPGDERAEGRPKKDEAEKAKEQTEGAKYGTGPTEARAEAL
ncbi:hypothetical protein EV426DRAFT_371645 [Tirmania nivea]|nr:hypothetical protein EV426DRAFT_371645 [Tirmania nivea]